MDESEHLRLELQMVETERVRLSLLEEKLEDVLRLLQRLRDLVGSRELAQPGQGRSLGCGAGEPGLCRALALSFPYVGRCHLYFQM